MKKLVSIFVLTISLMIVIAPSASATSETPQCNSYIEYYEDGSYTITIVRQYPSTRASNETITKEKIVSLYNSSDELQWDYTLIGTFNLDYGVSVVCTGSTFSYEIYDDSWSLTAHNNGYYDNMATGTATFKKKFLFITISTYDIDAEVGCDIYGNVIK